MSDPAVRTRIEALLAANPVVLFMKGTPDAPRCGFSAATVDRLNDVLEHYASVDVLEDEAIRQGIKDFGNWPTIPQLYVHGELVGGADIVQSMYDSGELHQLLGAQAPDRTPPEISVSDAAVQAISAALGSADDAKLFLVVDARFQPQFQLREVDGNQVTSVANGLEINFDLASAQRARGAVIDWVETPQGAGLSIYLPLGVANIHALDVATLQQRMAAGTITVIDVRPAGERELASFAGAEVFDPESHARLTALPKDTPLAFLCHHGNSSRSAAEHFRDRGFSDLHNVEGGIDAWSQQIDPSVPRY